MKKITFNLFILLLFASCMGLAIKEKLIDNYYLIASDDINGLDLCYHESSDGDNYNGIIEATVFAVGYNKDYMIVKQHPRIFPNPPDKKITNYYILPLKKEMDWKTKNGLIGPLNLMQFNEKRKELNIPDNVTFTKVIKELE